VLVVLTFLILLISRSFKKMLFPGFRKYHLASEYSWSLLIDSALVLEQVHLKPQLLTAFWSFKSQSERTKLADSYPAACFQCWLHADIWRIEPVRWLMIAFYPECRVWGRSNRWWIRPSALHLPRSSSCPQCNFHLIFLPAVDRTVFANWLEMNGFPHWFPRICPPL
jgi:hypothetical protein